MENNSELINSKLKEYCEELKRNYQINNRVLLVKVPSFDLAVFELDVARKRSYYAYPPTGLQYLSSALSKRGLDIRILDLNYEILKRVNSGASFNILEWMQILEKHLGEFKPSIIGVSNLFNSEKSYFIQILEFLKNKQYIVITGGQNATYNGEALIKKELCHFVCKREGENKINYLFDYLYEIKNCPPVPEILFKYKGNLEQTEGERDRVKLAGNLIDTYKLVPIEEYCQAGSLGPFSRMAGKDSPFATIIFNRGCEGNCKFCNVADYMGRGIRSRDAGDVLNEIEYLYKNRNIRHFEFLDDDFTANKSKALEILQGIIDRNLKITWASSNGLIARTLDYEIMKKMRESGCIGFRTGVESGNSEVLKRIGKPGNLEDFKRFSELAQKFPEMFISDNYIFGLPEENFGQILESYKFSLEMNLDWSNYSVYQHSVNYFGNKEERVKELPVEDFIPTKHVLKGKIASHEEVQEGVDVFNIPKSEILSKEQLNQVWFSFNLIRNFILNKNLIKGGAPNKFISWVGAIQERYLTHPYISIFLSLAYLLENNKKKSNDYYEITKINLEDEYWKKKFKHFGLMQIADNFPENLSEAEISINMLRGKYLKLFRT